MIGMNAKDALGAMEDVAIFNNVFNATQDNCAANEAERNTQAFNAATVALRERAGMINRLRGELTDVQHNRNYAAVLFLSTSKVLDHVVRDFAKAAGVAEEEMRKRYNEVRTRHFNQQINEGVEKGWFRNDPRLELSADQKKWYVPGLDADHGF